MVATSAFSILLFYRSGYSFVPRREGTPVLLSRIDHVGIAVINLEEAIERYRSAFGLEVAAVESNDSQGVREAMLRLGPSVRDGVGPDGEGLASSYVQLLEPLGPDTPVGKFLARRGEGLHHVGYAVDDVQLAIETLASQGVRMIDSQPRHGSLGASIAFAHPKDLSGVLTELVQAAQG
jgi:methylmalonyl-CoA/ethylmalonyl-CoA epimerase